VLSESCFAQATSARGIPRSPTPVSHFSCSSKRGQGAALSASFRDTSTSGRWSSRSEQRCGAESAERSADCNNRRDGYRDGRWQTRANAIELRMPKPHKGSNLPALLEPRRTAEKALVVIMREAYIGGVSTRSCRRWARPASRRVSCCGCAVTSTSALARSSIGRSKTTGRTCRSTRRTPCHVSYVDAFPTEHEDIFERRSRLSA